MKVLVTGANGQLGYDVVEELQKREISCYGATRQDFDFTDFFAAENFIKNYEPDVVIHCGAYTAVDKAEDEPDLCFLVNEQGTRNMAKICKLIDAKMVYISTDYVFDGNKETPYEVDDIPNPQNIYGKSKLAGEQAVKGILNKYFIVRISWVFGKHGNNFVKTMLRLGKERKEISVVNDQVGNPTYTVDLAVLLCDMLQTEKYGVYHATNDGYCSWAEFAEEIFKISGTDVAVKRILSSEYPVKAKRPLNSKLSKIKLYENNFQPLRLWKEALLSYVKNNSGI